MPVQTRRTAAAAAENSVPQVLPQVEPTTDTLNDSDVGIASNPDGNQRSRSSSLTSLSSTTSKALSVGELPEEGIKKLEAMFALFSTNLENSIKEFPCLKELKGARKNVKRIQQQLEEVQAFRVAQRKPTAMIIPFSDLSWPKLNKRLGVKPLNRINNKGLKLVINGIKEQHRLAEKNKGNMPLPLYPPDDWEHTTVRNNLQNIQNVVLQQNEASARFAINEWILQLGKHIAAGPQDPWIVIAPEPVIQTSGSRKKTKEPPTSIEFNDYTTALTGVADYILTSQDKLVWTGHQYNLFLKAKKGGASWNDPKMIKSLKNANINVLEAKPFIMQETQLKNHLPQVIGECIQIMYPDSKRQEVPFYLTNGKIWIFGIVTKCQSTKEGVVESLYEVFTLPTFDIKLEDIVTPHRRSEKETQYELFLTTMIAWIKVEASTIMKAILQTVTADLLEEEASGTASEKEDDDEASEEEDGEASDEEDDNEAFEEEDDDETSENEIESTSEEATD